MSDGTAVSRPVSSFDEIIPGSRETQAVFIYDGSFEGFLSAVFDAYDMKTTPMDIAASEALQQSFDTKYHYVTTTPEKSDRVMAGLSKNVSDDFAGVVIKAFLSEEEGREIWIYRYIVLGFKVKEKIFRMLYDDVVIRVTTMSKHTGGEAGKLIGFLRFSVMENELMYAEISPISDCLAFIMPHFSDRMRGIPFLIHDLTHNQVGVFDTKEWYIRSAEGLVKPKYCADELEYRRMWKCFYDTIAIQGRVNPKLRRQHMPTRYHKHMTEMNAQLVMEKPETGLLSGAPKIAGGVGNTLPGSPRLLE